MRRWPILTVNVFRKELFTLKEVLPMELSLLRTILPVLPRLKYSVPLVKKQGPFSVSQRLAEKKVPPILKGIHAVSRLNFIQRMETGIWSEIILPYFSSRIQKNSGILYILKNVILIRTARAPL